MQSMVAFSNRTVIGTALGERKNLAYLVHDIRSVATSVSLMVDLLELAAKAGDDSVQRERAISAQGSCQQMALLCAEAASYMAGTDVENSKSENFELLELLDEVQTIYSPIFDLVGKTLKLISPNRSSHITGDRTRIFRAISNLLDNALKHTSNGATAAIACTETLSGLIVSISDSGPGLANLGPGRVHSVETLPVVIRHISNSGAIFSPGTGLRYVSETMASHNGASKVELNKQGGSTFSLIFPIQRVGQFA